MNPSAALNRLAYSLFSVMVGLVAACGSPPPPSAPGQAQQEHLPRYEGRSLELFDDRIDRGSLEATSAPSIASDHLLRQRAQAADYIVRVRITAMTADGSGPSRVLRLNAVLAGEPVAGSRPKEQSFDFEITQANSFYGVLNAPGIQVKDRIFIAYLKRFAGTTASVWHFYMSSESPEVVAVIQKTRLLLEVRSTTP